MLFTVVPLTCLFIGFYDGFFGPGAQEACLLLPFTTCSKMDLVSSSANSKTFNFASNIGALVAFVIAGKVIYLLAFAVGGLQHPWQPSGQCLGSRGAMTSCVKL